MPEFLEVAGLAVAGMFFAETGITALSTAGAVVVLHLHRFGQCKECRHFAVQITQHRLRHTMVAHSHKTNVAVGFAELLHEGCSADCIALGKVVQVKTGNMIEISRCTHGRKTKGISTKQQAT